MLAKPCPTELTAPINPDRGVEGHRNLFCTFYDACLDEAVKKGWNSWTCTRCALHAVAARGRGRARELRHPAPARLAPQNAHLPSNRRRAAPSRPQSV